LRVGNRFGPASSTVAGRGTSRLPPWPWAVAGLAFEVFPRWPLSRGRSTLMTFASPSERSRLCWNPPHPGEPGLGSSSRGLARLLPLRRVPSARPLPSGAQRRRSSGRWFHAPTSFRPRGFSPPRRLSPRRGCGFVAPRCRPWGSSRFRLPAPAASAEAAGARTPSPRCGLTPFEGFPSPIAAPHHCGRCLHAVAARSCCRAPEGSLPIPRRALASLPKGAVHARALW
jgi:hypothetical protein